MKRTTSSAASNQQESYLRARDNPFFDGMRRGEAAVTNKGGITDFQAKLASQNIYRSASDIGSRGSSRKPNIITTITEDPTPNTNTSPSVDIVLEPIGRSTSGKWSKTSSPLLLPSALDIHDPHDLNACEQNEQSGKGPCARTLSLRSYSVVNKRQTDLSNVPLPPSAALFYNGPSPQMEVVESCQSVFKLNMYLKATRVDVNSGVPGRFLHAVIGPDVADVGSLASTIMYAFYLHETLENQFCTVPVINMKRADFENRADLQWLIDSCHVDVSYLTFIDEVDLFYYDLFGSLKLVLVNCDKIPYAQEALRDAIVEVFHCTKSDSSYSRVDFVTVRQDASCCTVIAEKFMTLSPEILAGKGFSKLLLAGILLDTGNLSSPFCTLKDNYMATLLINGAGRFGCNGLYQILNYKAPGSSDLKVREILLKEFKIWTGSDTSNSRLVTPNVGMSSIGMSVAHLLAHDPDSVQEIIRFRKSEKIGLHLVVSGYYDSQKRFKREILVSGESAEIMRQVLLFLNSKTGELPLKDLHKPGLKDEMRVFEIDKVTSRRTIERLLDEYTLGN